MPDEISNQENPQSPSMKLPEAPKLAEPQTAAAAQQSAAPTPPPQPQASEAKPKPAPSFELPKAKFGIANKAAAAVPVQKVVKDKENPSILSVAIDALAAAVAIAFAVMIVLDI